MKSSQDECTAVFRDTIRPTTTEEILTKVILGPPTPETFESYRARAELTLRNAGFIFEAGNSESLDRLTADPNLSVELWEAAKLIIRVEMRNTLNDLANKILDEVAGVGDAAAGYDNLRILNDRVQTVTMEIGALAERIKGRESQKIAQIGRTIKESAPRGSEAVHGTPEEKVSRWKTYQDELNRVCKSGMKYPKALKRVAAKFDVHPRTIRRHTSDPTR